MSYAVRSPIDLNMEHEENDEQAPKTKEVNGTKTLTIPGFEWDSCKDFENDQTKEELDDQSKYCYIDIAPYLRFSQREAARKIGVPSSTLSKRWKEATMDRKWPFRMISKIEKDLKTLTPTGPNDDLDGNTQLAIKILQKRKREHQRPVFIRLPRYDESQVEKKRRSKQKDMSD